MKSLTRASEIDFVDQVSVTNYNDYFKEDLTLIAISTWTKYKDLRYYQIKKTVLLTFCNA